MAGEIYGNAITIIREITKPYELEDIRNLDEAGSFWSALRNCSNTRQRTLPGFQVRGVRSNF